jgi:hypothetical protein
MMTKKDPLRTLAAIKWHATAGMSAFDKLDLRSAHACGRISLAAIIAILDKFNGSDELRQSGNVVWVERPIWEKGVGQRTDAV